MPAAIERVEPLFELTPPSHIARHAETDLEKLQIAEFVFHRQRRVFYVRPFNAIFALRASAPTGDWLRQVATVFRARDAYNGVAANAEPPSARLLGS